MTLWKQIKQVFPNSSKSTLSSAPFIDSSDHSALSKATTFCKFFATIASDMKTKTYLLVDFIWKYNECTISHSNSSFKFDYISKIFIEKELNSLKINKAAGIDLLPLRLIRDISTEIAKPISFSINLSLKS